MGDIDNDGGLDLVVTEVAGPAKIYRNMVPNRGHWLLVRALDPKLNRDAYGAEIVVRAAGKSWLRLIHAGGSYLSSNDPRAHFGLGSVADVDTMEVRWPDGTRERFSGGSADRLVVVLKGSGTAIED
jgi:hypothetical protein